MAPAELLSAWRSVLGQVRVERLPHHHDRVWVVTAEDGGEYVLKKHLPLDIGEPRLRLASEHRVLSHLWAAGVPVAVPLVADDARIHTSDGEDLYTLSPRLATGDSNIEGRTDALAVYARIGEAIGLLHKALAEFPYLVPSYDIVPAEMIAMDSWPTLRRANESLAQKVDCLASVLVEAFADLPRQLIHGDCHDGNVLIHDGQVSGFIDLDHLPIGPRIHDLGRYLANRILWAIESPSERGPAFRSFVASLVAGYDSVNALSGHEKAAVGPAILLLELSNAEWCLSHGDASSSYVTGVMKAAHWIADDYEAFRHLTALEP